MKLDRVLAVRNNKTIYRDGDDCIKVFAADYAKDDVACRGVEPSQSGTYGDLTYPKSKP